MLKKRDGDFMREFFLKHANAEYQGYFTEAADPKAVIAVIHGIGEHFGRYDRFSAYMAEHGYSVYGIDLPGHGKSPGIRGNIGKRGDFYNLTDALITHAAKENPGLPVFLMGHSMGGNLVLSYRLAREKTDVKSFIVSSPWIRLVKIPAALAYFMALAASMVVPNMTMKNGIKNDRLYTPSEEVSDDAMPDSLCHPFITPRTAADCFKWANMVLRNAGIKRKPFYLMHGSKDGICSVEGSRMLAAAAGDICAYREWDGLKHEMLNEAAWKDVADGIIFWLEKQI
jgi:alpha-beta hydrolase superfamily lysophospholipase